MQELFTQLTSTIEAFSQARSMDEMNRLQAEKQRLTSSIVEVRNRRPPGANPKINIRNRLYEGVTIQTGNGVEEFTAQLEGPLSMIENSVEGGVRQVALSGLELHADQVERMYLDEQQRRQAEEAAETAAAEAAVSAEPSEDQPSPEADPKKKTED